MSEGALSGLSGAFLDLPDEMCDPSRSAIAVLPVAYDGTSTWKKGADRGPAALLEASGQVEWFDIATRSEVCRHGIVTLGAVEHDGGPEGLAPKVRGAVEGMMDRGWFPVVLGGEHSVTIGAVEAVAGRHEGLVVLQIDAHGDTRESYHGSSHNHACVMARAREVAEIVQVGIRAIEAGEMAGMDPARTFFAHEIVEGPEEGWMGRVEALVSGRPVYVTIDLDAFDPSLLPATGTPEPGGMTWGQVNRLLERVVGAAEVVGFDVVELCPQPGAHASEMIAAKLVHRFLSVVFAGRE